MTKPNRREEAILGLGEARGRGTGRHYNEDIEYDSRHEGRR